MKHDRELKSRLESRFFQLENEILIPFLLIGMLVIIGFAGISYYNGYSMKMRNVKQEAKLVLDLINQDINYLYDKIGEDKINEKYRGYYERRVHIWDGNGAWISGAGEDESEKKVLAETNDNRLGWKISYQINERKFWEDFLEEQRYLVIGAVAALLIIIQASVFIAYNISSPIRSMSETCKEIDKNKGNYREYKFRSINRKDEIGQLASTFQNLLQSMDNYTKMDYTNKMASALAHEIKNPLTGIRSGIQVLKRRVEKPGDLMLCDSMIKEIDRVTGLITNLFTLSVKKESVKTVFEIGNLLEELKILYHKTGEDRSVILSYTLEENLTCYANPNEVKQIFHNLISNSVKAVESGKEGNIKISAFGKGENVVMILEDNAGGMTREELEMALEPFYTKSINGIGLGLAIVKKLVEQNNGTMKMESWPGKGTKTTLEFCRGERDEEQNIDCR